MINNVGNTQMNPSLTRNSNQAVSFGKGDRALKKFLKSAIVGTICETAANNPVLCQSAFSLGINCVARPATNYAITPDKTDAGMASAHSVASGVVGFIWPMIMVTPITTAVALVLKKPQKFLKPEVLKKFYPTLGIREVKKDGKVIKEIMTDAKGNLLRQDGSMICREVEPLKIKNGEVNERLDKIEKSLSSPKLKESKRQQLLEEKEELLERQKIFLRDKAEFEATHEDLVIDKNGVARSTRVFKTKNGKPQLDGNGNPIGCVVQKDGTPITEELERGLNKENNTKYILQWAPDFLLAVPRSILTVACIPWILKNVFGMEKKPKGVVPPKSVSTQVQPQKNNNVSLSNQQVSVSQKMSALFNKKGGI